MIDLARRLPGKGRTVGLKAGSTWSIFAPLSPAVLGLAWGWGIGNAWQRQPQLQLYLDEETSLGTVGVRLAACRPMTGDSTLRTTNISANIDAGDASSTPMMEAELRLERKAGPFSCFVSLAALTGKEDYTGMTPKRIGNADYRVVGNVVDVKGVALALKLDHRRFAVQGEYYTGENLDLFGAQVLSGVKSIRNDVTRVLAVLDSASVRGGWGQLTVKPAPGLEISGGVGVDDPEDHPSSFYKRNGALYCSASKTWFKRLMLTLCWIRVRTRLTSIDQVMEGHHMSSSLRLSF
ncbi:MAG: hypothetical protein HY815_27770 [Candidatus Riflebacteria bacterium]|nr:hypothetical protein [Candidatus Riflebacteria bacterium]